MRRTLSILLPSAAHLPSVDAVLNRWTARGDRLPDVKPGRYSVLRSLFLFPGKPFPAAALIRQCDAADAGNELWLCADPVYLHADMATVRMLAWRSLDIQPDEADALSRDLKPLFGDHGFLLEVTAAGRWYLRCPQTALLPDFAVPQDVLGDSLSRHLPVGDGAKRWHALHNDVQIALHNHPVNAARVARGRLPVNGLWFWGGGALPEWIKSGCDLVASDDELFCALAERANVRVQSRSERWPYAADFANAVLDLADIRDPEVLDKTLAPLDVALRKRQLAELRLLLESGECWLVRRSHRWRLWRKSVIPIA